MRNIYTAHRGRAEVGLSRVRATTGPQPRWEITTVNVHPTLRGKGSARALMQRVLDDADAQGVTLTLSVWADLEGSMTNQQLREWYERLGFISEPVQMFAQGQKMVRKPHA